MPQPPLNLATERDYWIGDFDFISIDQPPDTSKHQTLVEARPGADGTLLWDTGMRGVPHAVMTMRDFVNLATAAAGYANYVQSIGATASVLWAGIGYDHLFQIVNVERVEVKKTIIGIGGRTGFSSAILVARWTLLPLIPPPSVIQSSPNASSPGAGTSSV